MVELINAWKLRALVVMSHKRVPALPNVPTVVEAGYPKLASEDWPASWSVGSALVIAQLNAAINKALKTEKLREAFAEIPDRCRGWTADDFGTMVRTEVAHWSKTIRDAGIKINP